MAKHYALGTTDARAFRAQVAAALTDYYGAGVTLHYNNASELIFSCPAIADKVYRINFQTYLYWYYGTSYVTGTTISDQRSVSGSHYSPTIGELVLADNYAVFLFWTASSGHGWHMTLLGRLTNGDFVQYCGSQYSPSGSYSYVYNTTKSEERKVITWVSGFKDGSGKMYKQPLIWSAFGGALELNGSAPATIEGLYNISGPRQTASVTIGDGFLMSPTNFFSRWYSQSSSNTQDFVTPLYCEFSGSVDYRV